MDHRFSGRHAPLLRRLSIVGTLSEEQIAAISALPLTVRKVNAGQEIVRQGDRPTQSCLIIDGLACRFKIIGQGARQIFSYHIAGDIPDLQSMYIERMDHSLSTLSAAMVGYIPHRALEHLMQTQPAVARMLWRDALIDGAIFREWMCNIGRRSALARISHLLCELVTRYRAVGLADLTKENSVIIPLPMTQAELGDAQGLSIVHVSRVIKQLKTLGLISISRRTLTVLDWAQLQQVGDFDTDYLHLRDEPQLS